MPIEQHDPGGTVGAPRAAGADRAPSASGPIRVAIVEDQAPIRSGLVALLGDSPRFVAAGDWGSMEEALGPLETSPPDVVLVDLDLPGISGTEGIRRLKVRRPELLTVVLTIYEDDERIFEALCAGACGYLLKKTPAVVIARTHEEMRKLLVEGHSYKSAAQILSVSTPTVAFHVRRIYEKLQVHSKSEAVAKALRGDVLG